MSELVIHAFDELPALTDLVHDAWLDLTSLAFDQSSQTLTASFDQECPEEARDTGRFLCFVRTRIPVRRGRIRFSSVIGYQVDDRSKISRVPINRVLAQQRGNRTAVHVSTSMDADIYIDASDLAVDAVLTDEIVSWKKGWRLTFRRA